MGKFKMKGVNFGKGTGNVTNVQLNSGPKPYYGGTPNQPRYINPDNPMFDKIRNPDKVANYVNMPEGTGPGANLYSSARIAARSDGGAGGLHIIQVQTTGEA